jgi:Protein of unknown function (DUF3443)
VPRFAQFPLVRTALLVTTCALSACVGNNNPSAPGGSSNSAPPVPNVLPVTVDAGPAAALGQINHPYVTVKICVPGSQTQCTSVDHVLLDTGSSGLRLVRSVLVSGGVALTPEADPQGQTIEECMHFSAGQTWGPVVLADVTLAGEVAAKIPVQLMDDTSAGAPPPTDCGANGTLVNDVAGFGANGLLGVGVFAQDCGSACVSSATPLALYYGCSTAGACTAENVALASQVTNPVTMLTADNNGIIVRLPNLQNANGDMSLTGELIIGLGTQSDNALPTTGLTVLGTDSNGDFTATYNGGSTLLPALIDSGTDSYSFDDPAIATCASGQYVGYYCPAVAPQVAYAVNAGVGRNNATSRVDFAIADPGSFVAGAAAFGNLAGGGGSRRFTWGMPFFYGRGIYVGIDQRASGPYTGPFYAY